MWIYIKLWENPFSPLNSAKFIKKNNHVLSKEALAMDSRCNNVEIACDHNCTRVSIRRAEIHTNITSEPAVGAHELRRHSSYLFVKSELAMAAAR